MRLSDIPQDDSILDGHQRACYAQDATGRYVLSTSRGWDVETIANQHANALVQTQIAAAYDKVRAGLASPLAYHMACCHMNARLLAATSGVWAWRIRRHMHPAGFARLSETMRRRYAEALGIEVAALGQLP